jgi:TPR repeat protein
MRWQETGKWLIRVAVAAALVQNVPADYPAGLRAFQNKDYASALREWRISADQGDPQAQNAVGFLYEHGFGVPANPAEALNWYRKAAEHGYGPAEYNLGLLYRKGSGGSRDAGQAEEWFEKAAARGVPAAQLMLGNVAWHNGAGDPQRAFKSWEVAARNGVAAAACNIAFLYANGRGVPHDDAQAVHWYQVAAEAGYGPAELALGIMLKDGRGAPADPTRGRMWMELARRAGVENAQSEIQQLDARLSAQEVRRAIDMAGAIRLKPAGSGGLTAGDRALAESFSAGAFLSDPGSFSPAPAMPEPMNKESRTKVSDQGPEVKWPGAAATGFFVGANGEVVTDANVVRNCGSLFVRTDARKDQARVIAVDRSSVAIVQSSISGKPLSILDSESESGQIKGVGYQIAGLRAEKITEDGELPNTGGPMIDSQGRVAGFGLSSMALTSGAEPKPGHISGPEISAWMRAHGINLAETNAGVGNPASSVVLVECKR